METKIEVEPSWFPFVFGFQFFEYGTTLFWGIYSAWYFLSFMGQWFGVCHYFWKIIIAQLLRLQMCLLSCSIFSGLLGFQSFVYESDTVAQLLKHLFCLIVFSNFYSLPFSYSNIYIPSFSFRHMNLGLGSMPCTTVTASPPLGMWCLAVLLLLFLGWSFIYFLVPSPT